MCKNWTVIKKGNDFEVVCLDGISGLSVIEK